jgi:DNA polymerase III subunit delta'
MQNSVFDELVDQAHVIEILKTAVAACHRDEVSQGMTHAWIFTGPPGSGRSSAAVAFAQAIICPNNGCGTCSDCYSVKTNSHPDVDVIRPEGLSIKVEEVRELLIRTSWAPSMSGWRVVVMEDADVLTESAANALLKAIEEPSARTIWLLCAPTLHDILPTIRSRCRHLQLRTPSFEAVINLLINRDHIESDMAEFAAHLSQGHIGRARYFATNEIVRRNHKTIMRLPLKLESLTSAFQAAQTLIDLATTESSASSEQRDKKEIETLQEAYGKGVIGSGMAKGGAKAVKELEKDQKSRSARSVRDSIDRALLDIATFYRDVMLFQSGNSESMINTDMRHLIVNFATKLPPHSIINKLDAIIEARENLAHNAPPLVTCETLMCRLAKY